ncbi:MAG: RnfABCDGE type electron transport complex subunit B [Nitrosomonadaceae bacterium]|nr:RnfABCDGE type electron transport complex subunit B [Nitrosomonadaceae bacterium]
MRKNLLIEKIDAILPQTQCRQCGFSGCGPYAAAIAEGNANINQCPPGDETGIQKLADLLGVRPIPLNNAHGVPKPRAAALIDEQICIGCTLCIEACPVDAIVGAARQMHTVIAAECTGCELCLAPCPVDCISMIPVVKQISAAACEPCIASDDWLLRENEMKKKAADRARARHQFRLQRLEREKQEQAEKLAQKTGTAASDPRKAAVLAALKLAMAARSDN